MHREGVQGWLSCVLAGEVSFLARAVHAARLFLDLCPFLPLPCKGMEHRGTGAEGQSCELVLRSGGTYDSFLGQLLDL